MRPICRRARSFLHRFLQATFDGGIVAPVFHVDEVDDDKPSQITQTQLPCNFVGGFEIGFEGRFFDMPLTRGAARVHVDRDKSFRRVDDEIAAGAQLRDRAV